MTAIEITTETPTEMYCLLNLIKKMEVRDCVPMQPVQKETKLSEAMPAKEGLGKAPAEGSQTETFDDLIGMLIEDLRANAKWFAGGPIPPPPDMMSNILKAARILEIEVTRRERNIMFNSATDDRILDVLRKP